MPNLFRISVRYLTFFLFILSIAICGCSIARNQVQSQNVYLLRVQAINLSEDRSVLSTHNDELILSVFTEVSNTSGKTIKDTLLPLLVLDSSRMDYLFAKPLLLGDSKKADTQVWICLSELDDDSSELRTHLQLKNLLSTSGDLAFKSKIGVDSLIKDNDFLGYVHFNQSELKLIKGRKTYEIRGNNLFDRYLYSITIGDL